MSFEQIAYQPVRLARGRAVTDADQLDIVLTGKRGQHRNRAVPIVTRCMRIDGGRLEQLAGSIDYRDLNTRAQPGIEADRRTRTGRRGEQQIVQIACEYANG